MRRLVTGLIACGLFALGIVAAVDALSGGPEEPAPAATTLGETAAAAAALRAAGPRGTITYSDEQCRLRAVRLPALVPVEAPVYTMCEPLIPSRGLTVWKGRVVWSGLGFHTVQVVLSRRDLAAAIERSPLAGMLAFGGTGPYEATQVVALGGGRFAVAVANRRVSWERLLAVFERRKLVILLPRAVGARDVLRPSPRGRYMAVLHPQGLNVLRSDGRQLQLPAVTAPHAVAWSPDDRWTALATRYSVYVFPSERPQQTIRIPLAVRDLDWGT